MFIFAVTICVDREIFPAILYSQRILCRGVTSTLYFATNNFDEHERLRSFIRSIQATNSSSTDLGYESGFPAPSLFILELLFHIELSQLCFFEEMVPYSPESRTFFWRCNAFGVFIAYFSAYHFVMIVKFLQIQILFFSRSSNRPFFLNFSNERHQI